MTANELVAKVKNLPPISQAALQLVNLLDQPAVSNEDVVQVLKYDNVLTAKLLRACNSPYFGLEEPVSSVDQAVLILGHHQILHIVLTLAFGGAMTVPLAGYAVEANELWRHSLTAATAAEFIVYNGIEMNVDPQVAFTVGLLHDIGKLVLGQVLTPENQTDIRALIADKEHSRWEAEKKFWAPTTAKWAARYCRRGICRRKLSRPWRIIISRWWIRGRNCPRWRMWQIASRIV